MSDSAQFNELAMQFHDQIDAFAESFYNASPDRFFYKKTYRDYVDLWGGNEKEIYANICNQVRDYPRWRWLTRSCYWLINHKYYKQYQWVVYKKREAELMADEEAVLMGWVKDPMVPLVKSLKFEKVSYLPEICIVLLNQLNGIFEDLTQRWRSIMFRFTGGIIPPHSSTLNRSATTHGEMRRVFEESKQKDKQVGFFEHKEDSIVYAKVCGFLKSPLGASIETLRDTLQKLNQINRNKISTTVLHTPLKQQTRRELLLIAECGSQLGRLSSIYKKEDSFKKLVDSEDVAIQSRQQAYAEGKVEVGIITEQKEQGELEETLNASRRQMILFKQKVSGRTAVSQKELDVICDFYKACGFFNIKPEELKLENVWKMARQYGQKFHSDRMKRSENLTDADVKVIEERYVILFKFFIGIFEGLKNVRAGEIVINEDQLLPQEIGSLKKEGEKLQKMMKERYASIVKFNEDMIVRANIIAEYKKQTAESLEKAAQLEKESEKDKEQIQEYKEQIQKDKEQIQKYKERLELELERQKKLKEEIEAEKKKKAERDALKKLSPTSASSTTHQSEAGSACEHKQSNGVGSSLPKEKPVTGHQTISASLQCNRVGTSGLSAALFSHEHLSGDYSKPSSAQTGQRLV